ncbi:organomercurial transporter MerC [Dasania marina]|uniref:organomercurial transporter MerC n=1 Tax=Dasania marina TaxID=471499 RepID=UPI0003721390|nr:organomercurial transporter MerC [Dasania marina]
MSRVVSSIDKVGVGGVIVAAFSCTACFPALGALAATLGLGFLSPLEGLAINILLPLFAIIALVVNSYGWYKHRNKWRGLLSVLGPIAVLATLYPLWHYGWSTYLFYTALLLMMAVSVADLIWPINKTCAIAEVKK